MRLLAGERYQAYGDERLCVERVARERALTGESYLGEAGGKRGRLWGRTVTGRWHNG